VRGHIANKGRRFYPVIDIGPDPETGKRRQKWHRGHDTKDAAERALTEILGQLDAAAYVEPSKLTLGAFLLEEWLPSLGRERRAGTVALYETTVRAYVLPHLGATPLQAVTPKSLNDTYDVLLARGGRGKRPLARKTVLNVHTTLRTALEDAVRWGKLTRNPAELAAPPRPRDREMHTWTSGELRKFLEDVRKGRLYAAWLLTATTGMRRGEVLGLRWRDVDLEAGRASVRRALVLVDGRAEFSEPKTPKSRRSVPLAPEAVDALRTHRKLQAEERFGAGPGYADEDLVFAREDGRCLYPDWFGRRFERLAKDAQVPPIRFHDLRHTFATLALAAGVHAKVVSEILGHSSIGITLDTYSHAIPALQEQATAAVAGLIFGTG
jgi:integrase